MAGRASGGEGGARPGAAERASVGRSGHYKATHRREAEAARRRAALAAQQSDARASRIEDIRRVATEALLGGGEDATADSDGEVEVEEDEGSEDADMGERENRSHARKMRRLRKLHRTLFFARQLQIPDWMLEAPQDLTTSWLLQVRPDGDRCLLLSQDGCVQVRRKNGFLLERYKDCRFPRGLTILDCVCLEPPDDSPGKPADARPKAQRQGAAMVPDDEGDANGEPDSPVAVEEEQEEDEMVESADVPMGGGGGQKGGAGARGKGRGKGAGKGGRRRRPVGDRKYAVCDVLYWGDQELAGADAECRMFWLESRFAEIPEKPARRARALQLIPARPVSPEALSQAYHLDLGYIKDAFLFLHRESSYLISEAVTPLALMWRDNRISRYVVDTPDKAGAALPERQAAVLELRGGGHLRTAERAIVAQLTQEDIATVANLTQGMANKGKTLLRLELQSVDLAERRVAVARLVGHVPARSRVWPDSWGRIAFQHLHRSGKADSLSFQALMRAVIGNEATRPDEVK